MERFETPPPSFWWSDAPLFWFPDRSLRCAALNCTGLCLLTKGGGARCACPEHFVLADDERSCTPNCTMMAHFVCAKSLKCIPFWWRCDTQVNNFLSSFSLRAGLGLLHKCSTLLIAPSPQSFPSPLR